MTTTTAPTDWLTPTEAAEYARCSTVTIRREINAGRLQAFRLAGRRVWRLRVVDVDKWLMATGGDEPVLHVAPRAKQVPEVLR